MSNSKGMRCVQIPIRGSDSIHVFSDADRIILQSRRELPSENDVMTPSFKVAIPLTTDEALRLANELLIVASSRLRRQAGHVEQTRHAPGTNGAKKPRSDDFDEIPF